MSGSRAAGLLRELFPGAVSRVRLSELTTWRVGGPADVLTATSTGMLADALGEMHREGIGSVVLGGGSNVLAPDAGCDCVVVRLGGGLTRSYWEREGGGWRLECGGGARLPSLAGAACMRGADGLVFAVGIPGTVGGAVFMNAGAYGEETSALVESVESAAQDGSVGERPGSGCGFRYRGSSFMRSGEVVSRVRMRLRAGDPAELRERAAGVLALRRERLPLRQPNAGSVFRRPDDEHPPGLLIEECGLKGRRVGGAVVSSLHANFILNDGTATSSDIASLICIVRDEVRAATGILLGEEVRYLGTEGWSC